jgi:hypothetical protein
MKNFRGDSGVGINKKAIPWIGLILCLFLLPGRKASAQVDQGTITGVVQDNTGAVIPGAQITLTDTDTGLVLQNKSDDSGIYTFSPIKIGNYRVSAAAPGFKNTSQENLHLNVQERLNVVLILTPGAVSQTVIVSTAPPLLQSQSSSVGQVMSTRTINNVPLNGRNWVFVAQLAPGVAPSSGNSRGSATGDFLPMVRLQHKTISYWMASTTIPIWQTFRAELASSSALPRMRWLNSKLIRLITALSLVIPLAR